MEEIIFNKSFVNRDIIDYKIEDIRVEDGESKKQMIIINALGIPEQNLSFNINDGEMIIKGKTQNRIIPEITEIAYSFKLFTGDIKNVEYFAKDGYLYIIIHREETEMLHVPISKIEPIN